MDSHNEGLDTVKPPDSLIYSKTFEYFDPASLSQEEIEANREEIDMEVEALESILMQDIVIHEDFDSVLSIPTANGLVNLEIAKSMTLTVYPDESVPAQLTKLLSSFSNKSNSDTEESKEKQVKIRISKVEYLPSFCLKVMMPVSYPSHTSPIFSLQKHEFYKGCEEQVCEKFEEIYEEGTTCVYECYSYLQSGFVAEYLERNDLNSLKCIVTSSKDYESIQVRSRGTFQFKFSKELKCCMICFENYFGNSFYVLSGCSHYFCKNCLKMYVHSLISDGKTDDVKCPDTSCKKVIIDSDIEQIASREFYEKLLKFRISKEVNTKEDVTWCPIPECCAVARIRGGNMFGECSE